MTDYRIAFLDNPFLSVKGVAVLVREVICPQCECIDLHMTIDTKVSPWKCVCRFGHEWSIDQPAIQQDIPFRACPVSPG